MTPDKSALPEKEEIRKIPKADRLLAAADSTGFVKRLGHGPVMEEVRSTLDQVRASVLAGGPCPTPTSIEATLLERLEGKARGSLRRVINATGVVIHTNLGRAPLSNQALAAMAEVGGGYSNLEYDLDAGERGDRYGHAAASLCRLTGAEAAVVVNNNAGSVLIALAALCATRPAQASTSTPAASRPTLSANGESATPAASRPTLSANGESASPAASRPTLSANGESASPAASRPTLSANGESTTPAPTLGANGESTTPAPTLSANRSTESVRPERSEAESKGEGGAPEVILSRGQLVEIGGGFRIPDVLRRSGARLVEVGTTNRTYLRDFEEAITERTRMLLSVHRSNFRLTGFVHDVELRELSALGAERGLWVMDDLGSGTLLATGRHGLGEEPTVQERVASGADLVCFSGDKLLGGPQAGILVGRREPIELVKRHPLMRALRVDKVTLAGLAATLAHYERGEAEREIPVWRAIAHPLHELEARARRWVAALEGVLPESSVRESRSAVGGGSLPEVTLPTWVLVLQSSDPDALAARLRSGAPPVIARIEDGAVVLDPRTVATEEEPALLAGIRAALSTQG